MRHPIEKPHRLAAEAYRGRVKVAFTACIAGRVKAFADPQVATELISQFRQCCEFSDCRAPIYCFMPDHVHAIIEGAAEFSDARLAFDRFKRMS